MNSIKIIPLLSLKPGSTGKINKFTPVCNKREKFITERLISIGFCPGRDIELISKKGYLAIARVKNENPFVICKESAKRLMISANQSDIENKISKTKLINDLFKKIKQLIKNLTTSKIKTNDIAL